MACEAGVKSSRVTQSELHARQFRLRSRRKELYVSLKANFTPGISDFLAETQGLKWMYSTQRASRHLIAQGEGSLGKRFSLTLFADSCSANLSCQDFFISSISR